MSKCLLRHLVPKLPTYNSTSLPQGMGRTRYLDAIGSSKEVVEEEGVTVDREQCQ